MILKLYTISCPATIYWNVYYYPRTQQAISHFNMFQHLQWLEMHLLERNQIGIIKKKRHSKTLKEKTTKKRKDKKK